MTQLFAVLLLCSVLLSQTVQAQQSKDCCRLSNGTRTLSKLGSEYRRLRPRVGSTCCNRFNSGLMEVMTALRDSLQPGVPAKRITALMGRPDIRSSKRYGAVEPLPGEKLLIYHWRGSHDFLYFVVSRGRVTKNEWYNAWE